MELFDNPKFQHMMTKLLDPDFVVSYDHLNLIFEHITQLSHKSGKNSSRENIDLFFVSWLKDIVHIWESKGTISPNALWFVLNILPFMIEEEDIFNKLDTLQILNKLLKLLRVQESLAHSNNSTSYFKLFSSFLKHNSGAKWMLFNNLAYQIKHIAINCPNPRIFDECGFLVSCLLGKSFTQNELLCNHIIKDLFIPIIEFLKLFSKTDIDKTNILIVEKKIIPYIKFLSRILEGLIREDGLIKDSKLLLCFEEKFHLNKRIETLRSFSQNQELLLELDILQLLLLFFEMIMITRQPFTKIEKHEKFRKNYSQLIGVLKAAFKRDKYRDVYELFYKCLVYFQQVTHIINVKQNSVRKDTFMYQIVAMQILPVIASTHNALGINLRLLLHDDELREEIMHRGMRNLRQTTRRFLFELKPFIRKFSLEDGKFGLSHILKCKQLYSRNEANHVIEVFMFLLGDIIHTSNTSPNKIGCLTEDFLILIIDIINLFIEEYYVSWSENVQSLSLAEISYNFLSLPVLSTKLTVKGLNLLNVAILQSMSPTLALLVNNSDDGNLNDNIADMLLEKLLDEVEEIRKSVLEVVRTITINSKTKFPPFQKILMNNNFPCVVFVQYTNDRESSVRIAALKCLQEMSQIYRIRKSVLEIPNILEQLIRAVQVEQNVSIQIEICDLIVQLYDVDIIEKNFYDIMTHIVFSSKDKKLKIKALDFWRKVIEVFLKYRGVLDGQFPQATFSKESKRIIHFNKKTITKCLFDILDRLSDVGCLAIFMHFLTKQPDLELQATARDYLGDFISLIKKYNITPSFDTDIFTSASKCPSPLMDFDETLFGAPVSPDSLLSYLESADISETQSYSSFTKNLHANNNNAIKCHEILPTNDFLKYVYENLSNISTITEINNDQDNLLEQILSNC